MAKEKSLDQLCREGDTVNAASKKPEIIVFAGPNGSGKSTINSFRNCLHPKKAGSAPQI